MRTLNDLKPGETAVIDSFTENDADMDYLMELGVMEGTPVVFVKSAPLGDPIEIDVRGYHLSLRRSRARCIRVN
ncbi:MAG TPA: ferrous iron transport protein A [Caldithrix abyssi]|uniref:Ferrous iron transport protein A n=1 Tax=Caldithrix abyssi TaxID=187145 RepID=A0A7V5VEE8_CALAY|nr:ferrous iron transport protein A [Caldithrix abyssi]